MTGLGSLTAVRGTRRAALMSGAFGLVAARFGVSWAAAMQDDEPFSSGGLGLRPNEFNEMYGNGEIGQGALIYDIDGETVAVAGDPALGVVTSVYWSASTQEGVEWDEAFGYIERFLPSDANLREVYTTPAAGIGPFARTEIYKSASLAGRLTGLPLVTTGSFMVAYQIGGGLDSKVRGVNAFIGERPAG